MQMIMDDSSFEGTKMQLWLRLDANSVTQEDSEE